MSARDASPASRHAPARSRRLARLARRVFADFAILSAALWATWLLRLDGAPSGKTLDRALASWPLVVGVQLFCFALMRVPRLTWSMIGLREAVPILRATFTAAVLLLAVRHASLRLVDDWAPARLGALPASLVAIDGCLALLGSLGARMVRRLQAEGRRRRRRGASTRTRTLLIGAGRAGRMVAADLEIHPELGLMPVGFLDDEPAMHGQIVSGLPVLGSVEDLPRVAATFRAKLALITIASDAGAVAHRVLEQCEKAGIPAKIIPKVTEILSGRVSVSQIRDVAIEDLLGRDAVVIEDSAAPGAVRGKVVLVTGAGGSIGSELCRQILDIGPAKLLLVERAENALYQIHRELLARPHGAVLVPAIADVCDVDRMRELFEQHRPHAVFHAAAHKHVPMMEDNAGEAVKNNLFGTRNVAALAQNFRSERFVLVSTDKAVNPTSVMGATKRLAELLVQTLDGRGCRFVSVRFGNVLSSAGSVIPLFREQIARGGPVTVTHPDMERFFMTIPEASRLVLEAAGICEGGEVMVLDMGRPIRIVALAEQMIRLSGFEPGVDIDITYTGMRPGEKLHEELAHPDEQLEPTRAERIFTWRGRPGAVPMSQVLAVLAQPGSDPDAVRELIASVLPEYRPSPNPSVVVERLPAPGRRAVGDGSVPAAAPVAGAPEAAATNGHHATGASLPPGDGARQHLG